MLRYVSFNNSINLRYILYHVNHYLYDGLPFASTLGEDKMEMKQGNRIAELREENGWTQEELASKLGIGRAALSHYEKHRREPDFETLTQLADLFQVSIDFLIGRTNQLQYRMDRDVQQFSEHLELSDTELLSKFSLTIDGAKLTEEEARRFIAFVRAERMMNL